VGGDLFCFLTLDGGRLGTALGDVSGKSVPAALLMSNVLASLKAHAQHDVAVHTSLEHINRLLCEDNISGKFVTLFFGVIDPRAGEIRYACAGHNPPLVVSAAGVVRWLRDAWVPLGIMPEGEYKESIEKLATGDVLVMYSDGVTEAETASADANAAEGDADSSRDEDDATMYGEERLAATVTALRESSAAGIVEGIVDAVRQFARGAPQADDLTIVVVKMTDSRAPG
jgi:sigma-B regulation protein RsbU (phosphoserine phosphatase)